MRGLPRRCPPHNEAHTKRRRSYLQRLESDEAGHRETVDNVLFGRGGLPPLPPGGPRPGRRRGPIVFLLRARGGERGGGAGAGGPSGGRAPPPALGSPLPVALGPRSPLLPKPVASRRAIHGSRRLWLLGPPPPHRSHKSGGITGEGGREGEREGEREGGEDSEGRGGGMKESECGSTTTSSKHQM